MTERLISIAGEKNVKLNEPMSNHCTFRAGGNAKYYIQAENKEILSELIRFLNEINEEYLIVGNGSNILVKDSGYDGVVIRLSGAEFSEITVSKENQTGIVKVGAGALLVTAAKKAAELELTGMETLAGIPGTVGGAVFMNAGAYGGEIKDVIAFATVMDRKGEIFRLSREELDLSYRHSVVADKDYIVLEAVFALLEGKKEEIFAKMKECADARKEKQPLEYPSAGSTFKRPEGYFAGKLIMDAGLRGYKVGGAQVSEKHCGFVINADNATATDIINLMDDVKIKVKEQFGVELEPEVRIFG